MNRIYEVLLRDRRGIPADDLEALPALMLLMYTYVLTLTTTMNLSFFMKDLQGVFLPVLRYGVYLGAAGAVLCFTLLVYNLYLWGRTRMADPTVEGPFYRASVPALRRWALYTAMPVSLADSALVSYMRSMPIPLWLFISFIVSTLSAAFIIEMLRVMIHKHTWTNIRHLLAVVALTILFFCLKTYFYSLSDEYLMKSVGL